MSRKSRRDSGDGWALTPAAHRSEPCPVESRSPAQHQLRVRVERRAKGKIVTVVGPFSAPPAVVEELAKHLKKRCGVGGGVHRETIELQGDVLSRARAELGTVGWGLCDR